jgi:hypothetical protein
VFVSVCYVRKVPGLSQSWGMSFVLRFLNFFLGPSGPRQCVQSVACNDVQMIVMKINMQILVHVLVLFPCYVLFTVPLSRHGKTE